MSTHRESDGLRVGGDEGRGAVAVAVGHQVVGGRLGAEGHDARGGARPAGEHAVARRVGYGVALRQD